MHRILADITEDRGKESDIDLLEDLAMSTGSASLCALGRSAPNPVLSTLRHFRHEYEAHIREKKCPSFACKSLTSFYIDPEACSACLLCLKRCASEAISGGRDQIHVIDQAKCNRCGTCFEVCPAHYGAVIRFTGEPAPDPIPMERRTLTKKKEMQKAAT